MSEVFTRLGSSCPLRLCINLELLGVEGLGLSRGPKPGVVRKNDYRRVVPVASPSKAPKSIHGFEYRRNRQDCVLYVEYVNTIRISYITNRLEIYLYTYIRIYAYIHVYTSAYIYAHIYMHIYI